MKPSILLVTFSLFFLGSTAQAAMREGATKAQALAFDVYAGDTDKNVGKLRALIARLKAAGYQCQPDVYARGVSMSCKKAEAPQLLIDFDFVPTRFPEHLEIGSLRANGVDGGELPKAKFVEFLDGLPKPR